MMYPFQKTEEHSYDTELTNYVEPSGGQSASCRGNQGGNGQRCETVDGKKSGDGFTLLASWKVRLDEACTLRPTNTHLLGASKVKYPFW